MSESLYEKGRSEGFIDGCIISQPIHEDRHTYRKYEEVKETYEHTIYALNPTDWLRGYGIGLDLAAIYLRNDK